MGRRKAGKSPEGGGGIMDRLLVPRLLNYAANNDISDLDEVADALRRLHKEYQRKQSGPFKQMVARAMKVVQAKGAGKPELQLQVMEDRHLASRQAGPSGQGLGSRKAPKGDGDAAGQDGGSDGSGSSGDEGSSSGSDSDGQDSDSSVSEDPELDPGTGALVGDDEGQAAGNGKGGKSRRKAGAPPAALNNSLLSMYAKGGGAGEAGAAASGAAEGAKRAGEPAAFAPPDVVAAAAARAIAAAKALQAGKGGGAGVSSAAAGPGTSSQQQQQQGGGSVLRTVSGKPSLVLEETPGKDKDRADTGAAAVGRAGATPAVSASVVTGAGAGTGTGAGTRQDGEAQGGRLAPSVVGDGAEGAGLAGVREGAEAQAGGQSDADGARSNKRGRPSDAAGLRDRSTVKKARRSMAPGAGGGGGIMGGGGRNGNSNVTTAKAVRYDDLGGIEDVLGDIREIIEYPLKHPEVYAWLGVEPPRGVLLHGPPGCGKTALANAIANECGVPFLRVSAPEIVSGMSGESEAKLRSLFQEALDVAPCIVFIDEIDAIFPKRESAQREMERRIVAQMLTCMDDLSAGPQPQEGAAAGGDGQEGGQEEAGQGGPGTKGFAPHPHVIVIGATNRPDALDPALRRAGRFDREISLGIPTEAARVKILQVISRRLRLDGNFDFHYVAKRTPGFVGADLTALCKEAAAIAVTRIFDTLGAAEASAAAALAASTEGADGVDAMQVDGVAVAVPPQEPRFGRGPLGVEELAGLAITMSDFQAAIPKVQPSVRREGFTTTPDVTWEDVGSLDEIREELSFSITQPIKYPEQFAAMGLSAAAGVLLYGPPGCGKTLVAKAVANDAGANFISIKGPELLNKYVGESERAVRALFSRARAAQPCVLFFDEMDALAPRRGTDTNQAAERVVNQLLTEMDGMDGRQGVFLVAATNRPDMIDPALLRPGRLDKVLYVPLPPPDGRASILRALTRKVPVAPGLDLSQLAAGAGCEGFSGADMAALVREACVLALKETMDAMGALPATSAATVGADGARAGGPPLVYAHHFEAALGRITPSVSRKDQRVYDNIRLRLRGNTKAAAKPTAGEAPSAAVLPAGIQGAPAGQLPTAGEEDGTGAADQPFLEGGVGGLGQGWHGPEDAAGEPRAEVC